MNNSYIQAFSALHKTAIYSSSHSKIPWNDDQNTPLDVLRKQVYEKTHTGFGKLNAPEKLAFSATALLLGKYNDCNGDTTGISIGTTYGSFSVDLRYAESLASGFPRPAYFAATLPSSPIAEVAILFKLKGPNRVSVGLENPGLCALENALRILTLKKAESMLVIVVNGVETDDLSFPMCTDKEHDSVYAYAFMLNQKPLNLGLNYRISMKKCSDNNNNSHFDTEESYFFDIITAIQNNKPFISSVNIDGMQTTLTLEKEF